MSLPTKVMEIIRFETDDPEVTKKIEKQVLESLCKKCGQFGHDSKYCHFLQELKLSL